MPEQENETIVLHLIVYIICFLEFFAPDVQNIMMQQN